MTLTFDSERLKSLSVRPLGIYRAAVYPYARTIQGASGLVCQPEMPEAKKPAREHKVAQDSPDPSST